MAAEQTIVAVSTPTGRSRRAVVRLSGPRAIPCARERFEPAGRATGWERPFRATGGRFTLLEDGLRLPVVLYVMRAPRSYTREDVVEIHLPGSPALVELVLDDLLAGSTDDLRPAEPGEFTRRAFLNGRIDLSQAEAVLAVIRARSSTELIAATSRLRGRGSRRCRDVREGIARLRAEVEAALDFAPQGIEIITPEQIARRCDDIRDLIETAATKGRAQVPADGSIRAALCGPPNAGKSSLLNRLAGGDHAIVHHAAGTTRDPVGAQVELDGVQFHLTDTAGLTEAPCGPDGEAVGRARRQLDSAHLVVLVLDRSAPLPPDAVEPTRALAPGRALCAVNKCDLPAAWDEGALRGAGLSCPTVRTSALTGQGLRNLRDALWRAVTEGRVDASSVDCLFNARQRRALRRAAGHLCAAGGAARRDIGYEFVALDLREAAEALDEVTGRTATRDVLDRIFSQFCIGK